MGTYSALIKQALVLVILGLGITFIAPHEAKPWILLTTIVATVFFAIISIMRHKQVMKLAEEIDEVLHSGRRVSFSTCREGDISILSNELAKMVARLSRTHAQLEQERNALADSLADISHQIRTPLTAASLMLPAIEHADEPRERIRSARELETLLERVSWLVTSLLKIAKVDAGAIHLDARSVSVSKIAKDALTPLGPSLDLHDIEIKFHVDEKATFTGDAKWSTEALENIIKNCMEHTPVGGSIEIVGSEDAISTNITITDTGPGISDEDLPHIFERFYRGKEYSNSTQIAKIAEDDQAIEQSEQEEYPSRPSGFGIGLALAQALISAQGGTLRACNASNGGAQFEIAFPKLIV